MDEQASVWHTLRVQEPFPGWVGGGGHEGRGPEEVTMATPLRDINCEGLLCTTLSQHYNRFKFIVVLFE